MDLVVRGISRYRHGDVDGALSDFEEALRIDATHVEARSNRGVVLHSKGDLAGAMIDFDEALKINPRHAESYCKRAAVRRAVGDFDGARADLDMSLAIRPDSAIVHCSRGFHRLNERDFPAALAEFDAAINLDSRNCRAFMGRGNAFYHTYEVTKANLDYRVAFVINPDVYARARSKSSLGDLCSPDETFADCERHLKRDPKDFLANARRGLLLLLLNRDLDALRDFNRYLNLSPTDRERLERNISEVKQLRIRL
jgi:tetratricopeptide (TPR) repeat protein